MANLHYPKPFVFTDSERGVKYDGPGTYDVPDERVEQYLSRGWERPEDAADGTDEDEYEKSSENMPDQEPASSGTGDPEHVDTDDPEEAGDREGSTTDAEDDPAADPAQDVDDGTGGDTAAGESDTEADAEETEEPIQYDDLTITEIEELLASREFDDSELRDLIEYEEENKGRSGAVDALESALDSDGQPAGMTDESEPAE